MKTKKGQLTLGRAPELVMIVGFLFLIMATIAYISTAYQEAFSATDAGSEANESGSLVTAGYQLLGMLKCNAGGATVATVINGTDGVVLSATNYTVVGGRITNASVVEYSTVNITYTYTFSDSAACNVTTALNDELSDNTSIGGIILTISLVGIILSILLGIFVASKRKGF